MVCNCVIGINFICLLLILGELTYEMNWNLDLAWLGLSSSVWHDMARPDFESQWNSSLCKCGNNTTQYMHFLLRRSLEIYYIITIIIKWVWMREYLYIEYNAEPGESVDVVKVSRSRLTNINAMERVSGKRGEKPIYWMMWDGIICIQTHNNAQYISDIVYLDSIEWLNCMSSLCLFFFFCCCFVSFLSFFHCFFSIIIF